MFVVVCCIASVHARYAGGAVRRQGHTCGDGPSSLIARRPQHRSSTLPRQPAVTTLIHCSRHMHQPPMYLPLYYKEILLAVLAPVPYITYPYMWLLKSRNNKDFWIVTLHNITKHLWNDSLNAIRIEYFIWNIERTCPCHSLHMVGHIDAIEVKQWVERSIIKQK